MKQYKILLFLFIATSFAYTTVHKHYISITHIEYIKEKESVQIISRIYIDDFESLLRQRYDKDITLNTDEESDNSVIYIEKYLKNKILIKINDQEQQLNFIGKKYEEDMVVCFLEIKNIKSINKFEVSNGVLFDIFSEQKNMVKIYINSIHKNFILLKENNKGSVSF